MAKRNPIAKALAAGVARPKVIPDKREKLLLRAVKGE